MSHLAFQPTRPLDSDTYLTQLQAAHNAAKARANKVCAREPGVVSIYAIGEIIAELEDEQEQAGARLDISTSVALHGAIRRLKTLIPA